MGTDFGTFKMKIPFVVRDLSKPIFLTIGATVGDGAGYPGYGGLQAVNRVLMTGVATGDQRSFRLQALYESIRDATGEPKVGRLLGDFVTLPFEGGGVECFFTVQRLNWVNNSFSLETYSLQPGVSAGGSSQSCEVLDAPVPPVQQPPSGGNRVVIKTELAKVAVDGALVWDGDDGSVHTITTKTGPAPLISVDGTIVWP